MKLYKWMLLGLLIVVLGVPLGALAQEECAGFARVLVDRVNVRKSPGGEQVLEVGEGDYVYVLASQEKGGATWYKANVKRRNDRNVVGWIRGDMLCLLRDEFTDIVKIAAGSNVVAGLKRDGTVVAMGERYVDGFDPGATRQWTDIVDIGAGICSVVGVTAAGGVVGTGNYQWINGPVQNAKEIFMEDSSVVLVDADGNVLLNTDETSGIRHLLQNGGASSLPPLDELRLLPYNIFAVTRGRMLDLYRDAGQDLGEWEEVVSVGNGWTHKAVLMKDGTVKANGLNFYGECDVSEWTDIVQVVCGTFSTFGVRKDGTVVAVGFNGYGECDVSSWRDIVQVECGATFTIGLKADGTVCMAGEARFDGQDDHKAAYDAWYPIWIALSDEDAALDAQHQ